MRKVADPLAQFQREANLDSIHKSQVEEVHEPHQHLRSLARDVPRAHVERVCFGRDLLHRHLVVADRLLEAQVPNFDVFRFARSACNG